MPGKEDKRLEPRDDDEDIIELEDEGSKMKLKMPRKHARLSGTLDALLGDIDYVEGMVIPSGVSQRVLEKFGVFGTKYESGLIEMSDETELAFRETPLSGWQKEFVDVELPVLIELIKGANKLNCKGMLDITAKGMAEIVRGKSEAEIKAIFKIKEEFTEEQKQQVLREHPWLREEEEPSGDDALPP